MGKKILIQGAMEVEVGYFVGLLEEREPAEIMGFEFYSGVIGGVEVVVSKTGVGTVNATMATTLGVMGFWPDLVINQGIAGAHRADLRVGDVIVGDKCCNIDTYKTPVRGEGEGSNPLEWEPTKRALEVAADRKSVAKIVSGLKASGAKVYRGTLGSGDASNREYDRIAWIHRQFENMCEDMESIGAYTVCERMRVPCVGVRIISNNELTAGGAEMDRSVAVRLQEMLVGVLGGCYGVVCAVASVMACWD